MDTYIRRPRSRIGRGRATARSSCTGRRASTACARPGGSPPRSSTRWSRTSFPGSRPESSTTSSASMMLDAARVPGDARLSRLHQELLHLDQPCRLPRHSGGPGIEGRRHRQHRRHPDRRRLARRHQPHVPGRRRRLKARKLVEVTYECMMLGIAQAKPGNRLGDIGAAIQRHAEAQPLRRCPRFLRPRRRPPVPRRA